MAAILGDLFSGLGQSLLSGVGLVFLILGVLLPAAINVYIRRREKNRQRKRLLYNVLLNSRLGLDPPDAGDVVRLNDRNDNRIENPSLAIVRITNDSESDIAEDDYRAEARVQFTDGVVRTVDVTDAHPAGLVELISAGIEIEANAVVLPRRHLNAGERFKLLILLSGGGGRPEDVKVTGLIRGGDVVDARRPKGKAARRLRVATVVIALLSLGALLAAGLVYYAGPRQNQFPPHCSAGSLVIGGSSAFATEAAQVAGSYASYCNRANVRVMPTNSQQGMKDLQASISSKAGDQRVAMSDGRADASDTAGTAERPVAIVSYTIILNQKVFPGATGPVSLSTAQIREVFGGRQRTWKDIDPRFAALPVKIVARGQSGSRNAFERYVLGDGAKQSSQGQRTSTNCVDRDYTGDTTTFLCEENSTAAVIDRVIQVDGAVGYADAPDATRARANLLTVALDQRGNGLPDIIAGYQFWTVEHAYFPATDADLAANFVDYLTNPAQESALQNGGYPPCSANQKLCASR